MKAGLDRNVRLGVLEPVPVSMVTCTKKNGSLRRTIDFQPLNAHATTTPSRHSITFHATQEKQCLTRGTATTLSPSIQTIATLPQKTKCIDDRSSIIADSFLQAQEWLDLCGRHGITLNPGSQWRQSSSRVSKYLTRQYARARKHEGDNRLSDPYLPHRCTIVVRSHQPSCICVQRD